MSECKNVKQVKKRFFLDCGVFYNVNGTLISFDGRKCGTGKKKGVNEYEGGE
jgi:hypothetical protein